MQKLMGFFKYGSFPFVVSFEIQKFDEKGRAYIKDVGWFNPHQMLTVRPLKAGNELKIALDGLRSEHSKRTQEVTDTLTREVENILGVKVK
jgi:hypothetical protein